MRQRRDHSLEKPTYPTPFREFADHGRRHHATWEAASCSGSGTEICVSRTWNCRSRCESFRPVSFKRNLRCRSKAAPKMLRNNTSKETRIVPPYSWKRTFLYEAMNFS